MDYAIRSRFLIFLFIFVIISPCRADFLLTAGGGPTYLSKLSSSYKSNDDLPLLKSFGLFGLDFEGTSQLTGPFEVVGGIRYVFGSSNVQYHYTNPDNTGDSGAARNLSASNFQLDFRLGLRWHFLRLGALSLYGSGGAVAGLFSLQYNEEEYKSMNANLVGFKKDGDSAAIWGYYSDIGLQIIGKKIGSRFYYRYSDSRSSQFITLEDRRIRMIHHQFGFLVFSKI